MALNVRKLKLRMGEMGLSVPMLAEKMEITPTTVYRWLKGYPKISYPNYRKLSDVLNVPLPELDPEEFGQEPESL